MKLNELCAFLESNIDRIDPDDSPEVVATKQAKTLSDVEVLEIPIELQDGPRIAFVIEDIDMPLLKILLKARQSILSEKDNDTPVLLSICDGCEYDKREEDYVSDEEEPVTFVLDEDAEVKKVLKVPMEVEFEEPPVADAEFIPEDPKEEPPQPPPSDALLTYKEGVPPMGMPVMNLAKTEVTSDEQFDKTGEFKVENEEVIALDDLDFSDLNLETEND
jgi:hypothetical protein